MSYTIEIEEMDVGPKGSKLSVSIFGASFEVEVDYYGEAVSTELVNDKGEAIVLPETDPLLPLIALLQVKAEELAQEKWVEDHPSRAYAMSDQAQHGTYWGRP